MEVKAQFCNSEIVKYQGIRIGSYPHFNKNGCTLSAASAPARLAGNGIVWGGKDYKSEWAKK